MHFSARPTIRLQTCDQWSILLGARRIVLMVSGTHIFNLSMGSGRLELKEYDVEDRHRVVGWWLGGRQRTRLSLLKYSIYVSLCLRIASCDW